MPRQSLSALIMTPMPILKSLNSPLPTYIVFTADTLRYAVTLNFDPVTLTFDREHAQYTGFATVKLCTKFERNQIIRGGVITI